MRDRQQGSRRVNLRSGEGERGRAEVGGCGGQHRGGRLEIVVKALRRKLLATIGGVTEARWAAEDTLALRAERGHAAARPRDMGLLEDTGREIAHMRSRARSDFRPVPVDLLFGDCPLETSALGWRHVSGIQNPL